MAYDDVDLVLDRKSGDVVTSTASIVSTFGDEGLGLKPDPAVAAIVAQADARVAPLVSTVVAEAAAEVTRDATPAGESALGDLVADAARAAVQADFAVTNAGGLRTNLGPGKVTRADLLTVMPFGNHILIVTLTGAELTALLEEQWGGAQPPEGRILQIAGFGYTWDSHAAAGKPRIVEVHDDKHRRLEPKQSYRVAVSTFLTEGGDGFASLALHTAVHTAGGDPLDADALGAKLKSLPQPFTWKTDGRIVKR
jgi:5'-nucleotidase